MADNIHYETNGLVVVEAEDFTLQTRHDTRRWVRTAKNSMVKIESDPDPKHLDGASSGAYLEILPDTRVTHDDELLVGENFTNTPGSMAVLSYSVHFSQTGRYYIWARAFSTGTEDNGVHFGMDGLWPESSARLQWCEGKHRWTWSSARRMPENHCGDPLTGWLEVPAAGLHTVNISMREDGFELDKFILVRDEGFVPQGLGPTPADTDSREKTH